MFHTDMGADGLRLVHYQHSQSALDLYDKAGMLIWSEPAQFRLVNQRAVPACDPWVTRKRNPHPQPARLLAVD